MNIHLTPERLAIIINALGYVSVRIRQSKLRSVKEKEILCSIYNQLESELSAVLPNWEQICTDTDYRVHRSAHNGGS